MATEAPKSIAEAIEDITEEDLNAPEETDDEVDETTDDDADDGDDANDDEEYSDDESDDDESDESEDEGDDSDDEEDADWGVEKDDEEDTDFFDDLTQEQLAKIKEHPELNALRKQLMKGYEKKTIKHANLVKLGEAYSKNPLGVLQAIADQMGLQVVKRGDTPEAQGEEGKPKAPNKIELAAEKLERLFGDKAGPAVREALNEFVEAVSEERLAPVQEKLSKADMEAERARFLREEADFRERHAKVLTPEIEAEVVKLGESGRFVPGPKQTAADFLDMLLDVTLATKGKKLAKTASRDASKKLRDKVERNRREREPRGRNSKSGVKKVSRLQKEPESFKSLSDAIDAAAAEMEDDFEE